MKKQSKFWAILLIVMMLFTVGGFGAFAVEGEEEPAAEVTVANAEVSNVTASIGTKINSSCKVNVSWQGEADYYVVSYGDVSETTENTQFTFNAVKYGHIYKFTVTPYTKAETEGEEDVAGTAVESNDLLVTRVTATRASDTDVTVSWDAIEEAESCTVNTYKGGTKVGSGTVVDPATDGSATLSDFEVKTYAFSITVNGIESDLSNSLYMDAIPAKPADVKTYSSWESINVEWTVDPEVDGYILEKKEGSGSYEVETIIEKDEFPAPAAGEEAATIAYQSKELKDYTNYTYKVYAFNGTVANDGEAYNYDGCVKSDAAVTAADQSIRPMFYKLKMKKTYNIAAKGNKTVKMKFVKNQTYNAIRFDKGCYMYYDKNGRAYYLNRSYAKTKSAGYTTAWNYSVKEAEYFINQRKDGTGKLNGHGTTEGSGSPTPYFVWVSTYTQHVYLFKGSRTTGWTCYDDWEIASGKASTPTPTGPTGNKAIWKHYSKHHGLKYWSCFSSENSFHGKCSSWGLGKPASNGCIRNANNNAYKIYKDIPKNSQVLIF